MQTLKIGKELQRKRARVCKLYRANYGGNRCYIVRHDTSMFTMVFEDRDVYNELVKKLNKGWVISCEHRANGLPFFRIVKGRNKVELTQFIVSKYNGLEQDAYPDLMVKVIEDARGTDNFLDCRRCNVYLAGIDIEHRKDIDYKVCRSPVHDDEEYIHITFKAAENPFTEIVSYERELDEMLRTPRYCYLLYGRNGRGNVTVNNGEAICNLSRFVAIYKYYFGKYRGTDNAVKNFINDFVSINNSIPEGVDAEHLNSNYHINTFENLMFVPAALNVRKRNYVNWFSGEYGVHPVINSDEEILFAYKCVDLFTHEGVTRFYKCKTFDAFVDWIRLYLGQEPLTAKLQVARNIGGVVFTPAGMIASDLMNKPLAKENVVSLKEHIIWRDIIFSLPDKVFTIYEKQNWSDPRCLTRLVLDMTGCI